MLIVVTVSCESDSLGIYLLQISCFLFCWVPLRLRHLHLLLLQKDLIIVTGGQASRLVNMSTSSLMMLRWWRLIWEYRGDWIAVSDWCLQDRIKVLVSSFTTLSCLVKSVTLQVLPAINKKIGQEYINKATGRHSNKERWRNNNNKTAQQQHALVNLTVTLQTNQENCA